MAQTVFFSWQVDTPSRIGRNFIKGVLDDVCKQIVSDTSVDEALRGLSVDSDTKNMPGQPPIVDTIFKKIDASGVFVGDVTFVGKRLDGRPTPNPNVLIEYGWALKSKTHERVILLMNTAYGKPSDETLPFNLKHVLWPITYNLLDDATPSDKAKEKAALIKILVKAVQASLGTLPALPAESLAHFPEAVAKDGPAKFRANTEALGLHEDFPLNRDTEEVFLTEGSAMWFRLMPTTNPKKVWPAHELTEIATKSSNIPPLIPTGGYDYLRAEDGIGTFRPLSDEARKYVTKRTDSVAFVFETGEIWAIETALLAWEPTKLFQHDTEKLYVNALANYSKFLASLDIPPPYKWIAGINGIKGRRLGYPPPPNHSFIGDGGRTCATDLIIVEGEYDGVQNPTTALLPFFKKIFEKCGLARPNYLPQ